MPVFEDIIQYLEYLSLDEPIIGLDYLMEVTGDYHDDFSDIKYSCTLCKVHAYITEVVQHLIGRKHRLKYLEKNRVDLVNWDPTRPPSSGKLIRAKAEIAERQDGRGKPKLLPKTQRRPVPRSSYQGGAKIGPKGSSFTNDLGPTMPTFGSFVKDSSRQTAEDYMQERYEDTFAVRAPLGDSGIYTERFKPDRDGQGNPRLRDYERSAEFSNALGLQDQDRRLFGRGQREEQYNDAFRKPPPQKDVLKEFYTEELRREQLAKTHKWPNDVDSQHERTITDYRHDALAERTHEDLSNPGQSRVSPSRSGGFSRKMSNIPDPFMRFLKGEPSHEVPQVRKRKSRFSDATAEELQTAHEMFADEYGPPDPKYPAMRQQIREHNAEQTDLLIGFKPSETYQNKPESSESTVDVFEMLNKIEIENEEEAIFLKERLCSVLREFNARKAERAAQTGPSRSVKDYRNTRPVTQQHTQERYGRTRRENLDIRRAEESYGDPGQVRYSEQMVDVDYQEHTRPDLPEVRYSDRKPYNEMNRWPNNNQPEHASGFDPSVPFPETYQEPLHPRDYESAADFPDYQSTTSHLPMERGLRNTRPPYYSRNLDKITSTLLEFVKRK